MPEMGTLYDVDSRHQKPLEHFCSLSQHTGHPGDNDSRCDSRATVFSSVPSSQTERLCLSKVIKEVERPAASGFSSGCSTRTSCAKSESKTRLAKTSLPEPQPELSVDPGTAKECFTASHDMSKPSLRPPYSFQPPPEEVATRFKLDDSPSLPVQARPPKRRRALHDVDGPGTSDLSCKKRRIRLQLITSRLSQPYSLPATHILNRESSEDTPVLSQFLKRLATVGMSAQKAGHQTELVRKAAVMNRVRLHMRQVAATRGLEGLWHMASGHRVFTHGVQLVTGTATATGAMFPGRGDENISVPEMWRPHTTPLTTAAAAERVPYPGTPPQPVSPVGPSSRASGFLTTASSGASSGPGESTSSLSPDTTALRPPPAPRLTPQQRSPLTSPRLAAVDEDETEAFPDSQYADLSDDDIEDVYADFGVLFGARAEANASRENEQRTGDDGASGSGNTGGGASRDEQFYEEYLDELDGIAWVV